MGTFLDIALLVTTYLTRKAHALYYQRKKRKETEKSGQEYTKGPRLIIRLTVQVRKDPRNQTWKNSRRPHPMSGRFTEGIIMAQVGKMCGNGLNRQELMELAHRARNIPFSIGRKKEVV